jgi:four helix bundle protein
MDQLVAAATGIGANLEEAKGGSSTHEFVRYVEIALREALEAPYWLRSFAASEPSTARASTRCRRVGT